MGFTVLSMASVSPKLIILALIMLSFSSIFFKIPHRLHSSFIFMALAYSLSKQFLPIFELSNSEMWMEYFFSGVLASIAGTLGYLKPLCFDGHQNHNSPAVTFNCLLGSCLLYSSVFLLASGFPLSPVANFMVFLFCTLLFGIFIGPSIQLCVVKVQLDTDYL